MKSVLTAGLLAALAIAPAASADAAVIYSFTQTSPTTAFVRGALQTVAVTTRLSLTVTDEAAANGFSFNIGRNLSNAPLPQINGLVAILLSVDNGDRQEIRFNLATFLQPENIQPRGIHTLSLTASAGGLLSGNVYGNNTGIDSRISFNGTTTATGVVNSDQYNMVCSMDACTYSGVQNRTTVPEPMSIALFGAGLAGLAVARRR